MHPTARERDIERRIASKNHEKLARLRHLIKQGRFYNTESRLNVILDLDGDINYQTPDTGDTALHFVGTSDQEITKQLIDRGADPSIVNAKGQTVVHAVAERIGYPVFRASGCLRIRKIWPIFVRNKNTINHTDIHGFSYLHVACIIDDTDSVELFLNNGASVDQVVAMDSPEHPGYTPLHFAAEFGRVELVDKLLNRGAGLSKDLRGMSPLHLLVRRNMEIVQHVSLYRIPVEDYPDINFVSNEAIVLAEMQANEKMIASIVSRSSRTWMVGIDLLPFYVMRTLKDASFNWEKKDVNECVPVNSIWWPGYSALHFAARFDIDTVKLLLDKGADIEIKDADGVTPFDLCVGRYSVEDIHSIISSHNVWRNILLSDGKTKLLDLVLAMRDPQDLSRFLSDIQQNVNGISVPRDSPLWPGFGVLHLAATLSKKRMHCSRVIRYKKLFDDKRERRFNESIELCLRLGADLAAQDLDGSTPVHLAFRRMDLDNMYLLLERCDGNSNPTDKDNLSLLHIACVVENENLVRELLSCGADANAALSSRFQWDPELRYFHSLEPDKQLHVWPGSTPLHAAVATTNPDIFKLLLEAGADLDAGDIHGLTPVHRLFARSSYLDHNDVAAARYDSILTRFVSSDRPIDGLSYLHIAAHLGFTKFCRKLLSLGADANSSIVNRHGRPIKYCRWDDLLLVHQRTTRFSLFLEHHEGNSPLHMLFRPCACRKDDSAFEIAKDLLSHGADILAKNAEGRAPIYRLFECDCMIHHFASIVDVEKEKRLVERIGLTKLHLACRLGDAKTMKECLKMGTNVNAKVHDDSVLWPGYTPLHMIMEVIRPCHDRLVRPWIRLLLKNGADVMIANARGETPLMLNITENYIDSRPNYIGMLWKKLRNSEANPVSDEGISHFHLACIRHDARLVERFLELGVDPNQTVDYLAERCPGYTPLHFAVCRVARVLLNDLPILRTVDLLLRYGANVDARDMYYYTPLHLAGELKTLGALPYKRLFWAGADPEAKCSCEIAPKNRMFNIEKGEVRRFFRWAIPRAYRQLLVRPYYSCERCLRKKFFRRRDSVKKE